MKQVRALIRPSSLHAVMTALDRLDVDGVTVSDVAASASRGFRGSYRGASYVVSELPMVHVEVVATDTDAGPIAWAIATAARTGHPDDGIVSIGPVEDARRIRTGARGGAAVSARLDAAETPTQAAPLVTFGPK